MRARETGEDKQKAYLMSLCEWMTERIYICEHAPIVCELSVLAVQRRLHCNSVLELTCKIRRQTVNRETDMYFSFHFCNNEITHPCKFILMNEQIKTLILKLCWFFRKCQFLKKHKKSSGMLGQEMAIFIFLVLLKNRQRKNAIYRSYFAAKKRINTSFGCQRIPALFLPFFLLYPQRSSWNIRPSHKWFLFLSLSYIS